jgi:hypothetical protein
MANFELFLALTPVVLQMLLVALLVRRAMHRRLRFFFVYTLFSIIRQLVGVLLLKNYNYFYYYWFSEAISVLLIFLALYEVFRLVFRNFYDIPGFSFLFPILGVAMLVMASLRAIFWPPAGSQRIVATIIGLEISVGFLQVGVFALFILLVRFFRTRGRQYAFGVALGFGIIAAGTLTIFIIRSEIGTKFNIIVRNTPAVAYIIAVMVWLLAFIKPQPPHPWQDGGSALDPEELITELRRYTAVAKGVLRR